MSTETDTPEPEPDENAAPCPAFEVLCPHGKSYRKCGECMIAYVDECENREQIANGKFLELDNATHNIRSTLRDREKKLAAHRTALKVATDYLTAIAKPALGGKLQQYAAQEALAKLKTLLP